MKRKIFSMLLVVMMVVSLIACGNDGNEVTKERVKDGEFTFSEEEFVEFSKNVLKEHENEVLSLGELEEVNGRKSCTLYFNGIDKQSYLAFSSVDGIVKDIALLINTQAFSSYETPEIMMSMEMFLIACDPTLTVDEANVIARSLTEGVVEENNIEVVNDIAYGMGTSADYMYFILTAIPNS